MNFIVCRRQCNSTIVQLWQRNFSGAVVQAHVGAASGVLACQGANQGTAQALRHDLLFWPCSLSERQLHANLHSPLIVFGGGVGGGAGWGVGQGGMQQDMACPAYAHPLHVVAVTPLMLPASTSG